MVKYMVEFRDPDVETGTGWITLNDVAYDRFERASEVRDTEKKWDVENGQTYWEYRIVEVVVEPDAEAVLKHLKEEISLRERAIKALKAEKKPYKNTMDRKLELFSREIRRKEDELKLLKGILDG